MDNVRLFGFLLLAGGMMLVAAEFLVFGVLASIVGIYLLVKD